MKVYFKGCFYSFHNMEQNLFLKPDVGDESLTKRKDILPVVENGSASKKLKIKHEESVANLEISRCALKRIKVGSRKSQLALFQSNFVVELLKKKCPDAVYEIITMSTTGDNILNTPLPKIGEKSLFTKELEIALEKEEVDMVVHSLKDLPTSLPPGMVIGVICKRDSPYDAVVLSKDYKDFTLNSLPEGSVIGTSSLRRIAQLKHLYPHLKFQSIRGNLNTRLKKLDEDKVYAALILAVAGLERMDLNHRISALLKPDDCLYAVGQGALAVECKVEKISTLNLISQIADKETTLRCVAERSFMRTLEGGCSAPVAVCSKIEGDQLTLKGGVYSLDGSKRIIKSLTVSLNGKNSKHDSIKEEEGKKDFCGVIANYLSEHLLHISKQLGINLANDLLKDGAGVILSEAKAQNFKL